MASPASMAILPVTPLRALAGLFLLAFVQYLIPRATYFRNGVYLDDLRKILKPWEPKPPLHPISPLHRRANATLLVICRNADLGPILWTMQQFEDRYNRQYSYPWVFLNDEPFTEDFKLRVSTMTDAPISFGVIPSEQWNEPEWINTTLAASVRKSMALARVPHGESISYRNLCRYNAGFLFDHELLQPFKYYWRIEPGVDYFCNITDDPLLFMQDSNKMYGFTMANHEAQAAVWTLWETVYDFMVENPSLMPRENMVGFVTEDGGDNYNLCRYYSNFEIADMDFWRSEAYRRLFTYLDKKGGIYYERWCRSAIQSIALSLFAQKRDVHFFQDIGYRHASLQHCPQDDAWERGRCWCDPNENFDYHEQSCLTRWERL